MNGGGVNGGGAKRRGVINGGGIERGGVNRGGEKKELVMEEGGNGGRVNGEWQKKEG